MIYLVLFATIFLHTIEASSKQCNFSPTIPSAPKKKITSNGITDAKTNGRIAVQATYTSTSDLAKDDADAAKQFGSMNMEDEDAGTIDIITSDMRRFEEATIKDTVDDTTCSATSLTKNIHAIEIHIPKQSAPVEQNFSEQTDNQHTTETKKKSTTLKLVALYLHFLSKYALVTKCITSGVIGIIGDFAAQCFEQYFGRRANIVKPAFGLDRIRLFGIFFESIFVSGPLMHFAYDYMEHLVPVHDDDDDEDHQARIPEKSNGLKKWLAAGFHVTADLLILGPIFVFTMMLFTSIIEGKLRTFGMELKVDFVPAVHAATVASLAFLPAQLFAFKHLPIKFRLLYMNLQDVVWNAVVSVMAHKSR